MYVKKKPSSLANLHHQHDDVISTGLHFLSVCAKRSVSSFSLMPETDLSRGSEADCLKTVVSPQI